MDMTGPKTKLRRAEYHFGVIEDEIARFKAADNIETWEQPDSEPPRFFMLARRTEPIPPDWSAVVGDFAHNGRSALNLLVAQLSNLGPGDPGWQRLEFPICYSPEKFASSQEALRGVHDEGVKIIEAAQPYGSDDHGLRLLRELNNADKHRLFQVVEAVTETQGAQLGPGGIPGTIRIGDGDPTDAPPDAKFSARDIAGAVVTDRGTVIAVGIRRVPYEIGYSVRMQTEVRFGPGDAGVEDRPVVPTLKLILDQVRQVVDAFSESP